MKFWLIKTLLVLFFAPTDELQRSIRSKPTQFRKSVSTFHITYVKMKEKERVRTLPPIPLIPYCEL